MSDGTFPDLGKLMEVAQKLQGDLAKKQEELAKTVCEASAGGGMVTVEVNGQFELVSLKMDPQVVDASDVDMLRDLIIAAVNQAVLKVRDTTQSEMSKLTGGLPIPGLG